MLKKICKICNNNFETLNSNKMCCTKSCAAKLRGINFKKDPRYDIYCQLRADRMSARWKNHDNKEKLMQAMKNGYTNPVAKENLSKNKKQYWENPESHEKMFISRYKKYTMPSGRIINIQGYENRALDQLLKKYCESDLLVTPKEINKKTETIHYIGIDNKPHSYCPDFFIISENKIIEVKSEWTYNQHLQINLLKKNACINKGFNFEFMIL